MKVESFEQIPVPACPVAHECPQADAAERLRVALSAAGVRAVVTASGPYCTGPGTCEVRSLCGEWDGVRLALEGAGAHVGHLDGGSEAVGWYAAEVYLPPRPVAVAPEPWQRDLLAESGRVPENARWIGRATSDAIAGCAVFVAGSLPPHLAAAAASVTEVPLSLSLDQRARAQRGELPPEERRAAIGPPRTYRVEPLYPIPVQEFEQRPDVVVTRHPALAELLRSRGHVAANAEEIAHASPEQLRGRVVAGVLPFSLACAAEEIWAVEIRAGGPVRTELSLDELAAVAGETRRYRVREVSA